MARDIPHNPTNRCLRCGSNDVSKNRRKVVLYDFVTAEESQKEAENRAFHDLLTWGEQEYSDQEDHYSGNLCKDCFYEVADFIRGN